MSIRAMRPPWNCTHGARHMDSFGMRSAPRGGGVEVIAIGAELDTVLRSDRVLQLWAAAEPGKGGRGVNGEARDQGD